MLSKPFSFGGQKNEPVSLPSARWKMAIALPSLRCFSTPVFDLFFRTIFQALVFGSKNFQVTFAITMASFSKAAHCYWLGNIASFVYRLSLLLQVVVDIIYTQSSKSRGFHRAGKISDFLCRGKILWIFKGLTNFRCTLQSREMAKMTIHRMIPSNPLFSRGFLYYYK